MSPLVTVENNNYNQPIEYTEQDAFDALSGELKKGICSMKSGEVYTVEEAWEEIDRI